MSTVMVSIALHGLIALVPVTAASNGVGLTPVGTAATNRMAALLVNAQDPGVIDQPIQCIARHDPLLVFPIPDNSVVICNQQPECTALQPDASGARLCSCKPTGKKIWLTPDNSSASPRSFRDWAASDLPPGQIPNLPTAQTVDFSYFPNMAHLGYTLDPAFLNGAPNDLAARMVFPFAGLTTCALAVRPGEGGGGHDNVYSFGFRQINEDIDSTVQPHQAVAQRLYATNTYDLASGTLQLHWSNLDGSNEISIPLPQAGTVNIDLSNERAHLEVDDPCNDGVGRDFALFYKLAQTPEDDWTQVPLPHLMPTLVPARLSTSVEDPACAQLPTKGMMSRPICTMATFLQ